MMNLNIKNCPSCGRVFAVGLYDICPECKKEVDRQYDVCAEYLRENRKASMMELSEATGVTVHQITKFIREGRISLADLPNLGYPCDVCSKMIREGKICESCRKRFSKDVQGLTEDEKRREEMLREELRKQSYKIYED